MAEPWTVDMTAYKTAWLRDELLRVASKPSVFDDLFPEPPRSRWQRLKTRVSLWLDAHWPRIHLGPCDHEDCS